MFLLSQDQGLSSDLEGCMRPDSITQPKTPSRSTDKLEAIRGILEGFADQRGRIVRVELKWTEVDGDYLPELKVELAC
jgi:hypothetical protein